MKIIDLLNKIANGEEVPKKIKVGNKIYNYETFNIGKGDNYFTAEWEEVKGYRISYDGTYYYLEIRDYNLNDEVEILEEEKKTKPLTKKDIEALGYACGEIQKCFTNGWTKSLENKPLEEEKKIPEKIEEKEIEITMAIGEQICANKINEIIDYLKSKGE